MKLNKFFIVALAALTFAACSKDDTKGTGEVPEGVRTNATLVITQPNTVKIPATQATEDGILNEGKITDVTVFLFTSGGLLEKIASPAVTITATGVVTAKFEVLSGNNKKVFVIANATIASLDLTGLVAGTTTLAQFKKEMAKINATTLVTSTSDFVMTNLKDPGTLNLDPGVDTPVSGGTNFIAAEIGRIVGKIRPNLTSATANSGAMGALTAIKFKTINIAEFTYIWAEKETAATARPVTPYLNAEKGVAINTTVGALEKDVAYEDYKFETLYKDVEPFGTVVADLNVSYALENSNLSAKRGNTTRLVISGVFTPAATKFYDGTLIDADAALTGVADLGVAHQAVYTAGTTYYAVAKKVVAGGKTVGYEIKAMVNTATIANTAIYVAAEDVMLTYVNGVSYYGVWVSGVSTSDYTITRNGLYSVNINGVAGPGVDTENKVISEPELNIELKTNIIVDVKLMPWEVYEQEVILQ